MKAWVSHQAGGPDSLVLQDWPVAPPGAGEVLVRVESVGINFPDSLLLRDQYQVKPPRPFVPGSEFCGTVEAVGEGASFAEGDVVIGRCGWGAMAHKVVIAQERCIRVPPSFPRAEAAAFLFAYATAYHALHDRGPLRAGDTLLVLGAGGGVGSAAVEVGCALGAKVVAAASTEAKLAFARSLGAEEGVVYEADLADGARQKAFADRLKALAPGGFDVVLDPVGGAYSEPALRSLAYGGRHLVVGFTAGIPRIATNLPLLKSASVVGVDWRMFVQKRPQDNARNVQQLLTWWEQGRVTPRVTERFAFSEAPAALSRLETRGVLGKIVVEVDR
jgi:NADPH2:quinone reductase